MHWNKQIVIDIFYVSRIDNESLQLFIRYVLQMTKWFAELDKLKKFGWHYLISPSKFP